LLATIDALTAELELANARVVVANSEKSAAIGNAWRIGTMYDDASDRAEQAEADCDRAWRAWKDLGYSTRKRILALITERDSLEQTKLNLSDALYSMMADRDRYREALDEVLRIHSVRDDYEYVDPDGNRHSGDYCAECGGVDDPCPTAAAALTEAEEK
jgi:hypothetical protein